MRNGRPIPVPAGLLAFACALSLAAGGCSLMRPKDGCCPKKPGDAATAAPKSPHDKPGELPREIGVSLRLDEGESWKARFISTGEIRRTLREADGKEVVKNRSLGLELSAVQTVKSVKGNLARIEIREAAAKILQDGKFVDAPFRRLSPPDTVYFTIDTQTGKADFSEMEKAYRDWMATVKESPAGDILGKTFRIEGYIAQMKDLYGKPFTRLSGKKLAKEYRVVEEKEFLLPFVGPSADLGPMPVETQLAYEGFEVRDRKHLLNAVGKYAGETQLTAAQLAERLEEFGVKPTGDVISKASASGKFRSSVDVISGRELQTDSRVTYTATATFDGRTFVEEIAAKFLLIPEE